MLALADGRPASGRRDTTTVGMLSRAAAMSMPGTILSQLGTMTRASKAWAMAMVSIESAMSSRVGSEYFMPAWPMAMPSQTPITGNSMGVPPASADAGLDRVGDAAQVDVAGDDLALGVDDADEGPLHLLVGEAQGPESERCGARARPCFIASLLTACLSSSRADGRARCELRP